jgi:hypothetical protein
MSPQSPSAFEKMLALLQRLENGNIWYRLESIRDDTIMILVCVPGQYWEIELFEDGHIEFERFISSDGILDEDDLETALSEHEDD